MVPLTDHADLDAEVRESLERAVARLATLEHVTRWGLSLPTPQLIAEVITQDEYTQDVIMPWRGELHVVFDTT